MRKSCRKLSFAIYLLKREPSASVYSPDFTIFFSKFGPGRIRDDFGVFLQVPESIVLFGHWGLVFIWGCFVLCLLFLLF